MARDPDAPMRGMEAVLHAIFEPGLDTMMNDFGEADCFAVITHDPTTLYCGYIGPFATIDEAHAYRTRVEDDLNKDMPAEDELFQVSVVPMFTPEAGGG